MDRGSTAPRPGEQQSQIRADEAIARQRLDAAQCAEELLSIVAYITANDGPLQTAPDEAGSVSPWHRKLLLKADERLEVIDAYMRSRVAFLVAGRQQGYHAPDDELELAGAALDTCRAAAGVVETLLRAGPPSRDEFETMSEAALRINPALDAVRRRERRAREG